MNVKQFIIHRLEKSAHKPATVTKRPAALQLTPRVTAFSGEIRSSYRASGVKFGSFDQNDVSYPLQKLIRQYLAGKNDFVTMTHSAVDHLKMLADQKSASKGGYVVFSHYEDDNEFISMMVLNDKSGHAVDQKNLELIESVHLEMDKVHVASALNVTRWNSGLDPYLSFVEGSRDLAGYFLDFVGCTTLTSSTQQSRSLSAAIKDYLHQQGMKDKSLDERLNQIYDYCSTQSHQNQPIYLSSVAALVDPKNPSNFSKFARKPEYSVDESFQASLRVLKAITRVSYTGSDLRISFDHSLITEGKIVYDEKRNFLTIKQVPQGLRTQLTADAS
jgi:nucleoid-associated protein